MPYGDEKNMTELPLENIERIVTDDWIFNKIVTVSKVYSSGTLYFHIVYDCGRVGAIRWDTVKNIDYREVPLTIKTAGDVLKAYKEGRLVGN